MKLPLIKQRIVLMSRVFLLSHLLGLVLGLTLWSHTAYAEQPTTPPKQVLIRGGDRVLVMIPSINGVQKKQLIVDHKGQLNLEVYGKISIKGMSPEVATGVLKKHLSHWLNDTSGVSLVVQARRMMVLVTGQVVKGGRYTLPEKSTLWMAIQKAGSVTSSADLTRVAVYRKDKKITVNVAIAQQETASTSRTVLQPGDMIVVPSKRGVLNVKTGRVELLSAAALKGKVFVMGAVKQPGIYPWTSSLSPLMAIALAGGHQPNADLHHAVWMTSAAQTIIDVTPSASSRPRVTCGPTLACILFVPTRAKAGVHDTYGRTIKVLGEVKQQGHHQINGDVSLLDAVALAQGATSKADLEEVYVTTQEDGVSITSKYNVKKQLKQGGPGALVRIKPGQTIYVSAKEASTLSKVAKTVSEVAIIAAAFTLFAAIL